MGWPQPHPETVAVALDWLRRQDPRLALKPLGEQLRVAGYGEPEVSAAIALRQAELDAALPAGTDLRGRAAVILTLVFFGTWAVMSLMLIQPADNGYHFGSAAVMVLALVLGFFGLISLLGIGLSGRLRRGAEGALVAVLTIPFILLVIVAGLCVVTTNGLNI